MKKNKIIGLLVGVGGVVATVSAAFALYTYIDDPLNIKISTHVTEGDIVYKVDDVTSPTTLLSPDVTSHDVKFTLGSIRDATSLYPAQDVTVGKLSVTLTASAELIDAITVDASVGGYIEGSVGERIYSQFTNESERPADADETWIADITKQETTITFTKVLAVHTAGSEVTMNVTLSDTTKATMAAIAEQTYSVDITWGEYTAAEFTHAYIVGSMTGWAEVDGYQMNPDIDNTTDNYGWILQNLPVKAGWELKAKSGDTWASGDNIVIAADAVTTYRWKGDSSGYVY